MSKNTTPSWQDNDALLTYRVGPVLCCGPTLPIITITPPPSLTHLPGTNEAEPGIFKHGNYIVSATDLRYRFGVKHENWKQPGQVIIAQHGDVTRGYYVDEIKDVIHFPQTGWGQLPSLLPRGIFSRTLLLNKQIYLYTEFEKLSQLQGSGYLAEYISQLETLQHQEEPPSVSEVTPTATYNRDTKSEPDSATQSHMSAEKIITESSSAAAQISSISKAPKPATSTSSTLNTGTNDNRKKIIQPDSAPIKTASLSKPVSIPSGALKKPVTTDIKKKTIPEKIHKQAAAKMSAANPGQETQTRRDTPDTTGIMLNTGLASKTGAPLNAEKSITTKNTTTQTTEKIQHRSNTVTPTLPVHSTGSVDNTTSEKTESGYPGLIVFILFIFMGAFGVYYFLSQPAAVPNLTEQTPPVPAEHNSSLFVPDKLQAETPANIIPLQSSPDSRENKVAATTKPITPDKADVKASAVQNNPEQDASHEYHASIKQEDNTITIELDGPLPPAINTAETTSSVTTATQPPASTTVTLSTERTTTAETIISDTTPAAAKPEVSQAEQSKPAAENMQPAKTIEIIHIIKKGDTLWAIAKRYLLNPYRYPELAKLSKINNPDLIYPGNRVRIIYKDSKNSPKKPL